MPIYKSGDMWSVLSEVDYYLVTTNSTINKNGSLVMGAGIAKQAKCLFPGIDKDAGIAVSEFPYPRKYGLLMSDTKIGLFQVKYHWSEKANLNLIRFSTGMLMQHIKDNPGKTYALNYPGIGFGGLSVYEVKPVIGVLPNNIQIWSYE